jgi:prolipoprotein diacylglyceryl transferase
MEFQAEYIEIANRLQLRYYGIIIVLAMLVAAIVAARLAKRDGKDPDHVWGALTWAIIPAIILARLWFVVFPPADALAQGMDVSWFLQNIGNLENGPLAIWSGGLSIFGAVIGGLIGAYLYLGPLHNRAVRLMSRIWRVLVGLIALGLLALWLVNRETLILVIAIVLALIVVLSFIPATRRYFTSADEKPFPDEGLPIWSWLDIAGVTLPLGQAIGRWANFVNQELYGSATSLPWGITIDSAHRVDPYKSLIDYPAATTLFHPLFLYESLWNFLAFIVLLNLFLRRRSAFRAGDFFLLYILQYCLIRFFLEFLRVEVAFIPGTTINSSQAISVVGFVIALVIFIYRRRSAPRSSEQTKAA